jgi:hypothetical protein
MSVSYSCQAIVGVKLKIKDIRKEISKPVYEYQNRYDTKTGELVGNTKELVKSGVYVFVVGNLEFENLFEILDTNFSNDIEAIVDHESVYIGCKIKVSDFGRIDCPKSELSLEEIQKMFECAQANLKEIGLSDDVNFYIFPVIN